MGSFPWPRSAAEVSSFDYTTAQSFLEERPQTAPAHRDTERAIQELRLRVLVQVDLCWRVVALNLDGARTIELPESPQSPAAS